MAHGHHPRALYTVARPSRPGWRSEAGHLQTGANAAAEVWPHLAEPWQDASHTPCLGGHRAEKLQPANTGSPAH